MLNAQVVNRVDNLCSDHEFCNRLQNLKFKQFNFSEEMVDVGSPS
jgi:hypothetical protein